MTPLKLPYNTNLHKWIGYSWEVNAIALWWQNGKLMISDGMTESRVLFTSSWMRIETAPNFSKVLRSIDYGKYHEEAKPEEEQWVVVLDNKTEGFYYAPKTQALTMLAAYNEDKALTLESYGDKVINKVRKFSRWGSKEDDLVDVLKDISDKLFKTPTREEFNELCDWVERAKIPELTVV